MYFSSWHEFRILFLFVGHLLYMINYDTHRQVYIHLNSLVLSQSSSIYHIPYILIICVGNGTSYSYTPGAEDGPEHWGELSDEWQMCGTGLAQSPIDISKQSVEEQPNLGSLVKSYWPSRATLKRRSHHIEVIDRYLHMLQYLTQFLIQWLAKLIIYYV